MLTYPQIDPVAVQIGPVAVHWYGLAYVVALLVGLWAVKWLVARYPAENLDEKAVDDFFVWVVVGVIAGGRTGYALFYGLDHLLIDPTWFFRIWEGGMSFHGAVLGVIVAALLFGWRRKIHPADIGDRVALVAPLGLFLGRIANFVNGELWGRPAGEGVPWAMIFPHVDNLPRHPSQLYEAGLEGLVLAGLLWGTLWLGGMQRWRFCGIFYLGYAVGRTVAEAYRTPEIVHDFMGLAITQGQMLSLPLALFGAWALWKSFAK